jgi:hypothetical protein
LGKIKNHVFANGDAPQRWKQILPVCAAHGELRHCRASFFDPIKQRVGGVRIVLRDISPDFIKVGFS